MASIVKKIIKGKPYYYARECRRVNGKPKIVWQKYLGRAADIIGAVRHATSPQEADVIEYGLTAALYDLALTLGLVSLIDRHCPKREQGPSIGQYMLIAAINRCSQPRSKNKIGQWYSSTALRRLMPLAVSALSSQRFWDNMSLLDREKIRAIERDLAKALVEGEGIGLDCLLYDTTNFFTYIATETDSLIPQRGHNKQKRDDLKQIGLALLVSRDFHVPLFHDVYPGDVPDSVEFAGVIEDLTSRLSEISRDCQGVTLVFDKGNNSADNIRRCGDCHYVGALMPGRHMDLLAVPLSQYQDVSEGWKAYLTKKNVFGKEHTICVTWNEEFYRSQMYGLRLQLAKRTKKLDALSRRLCERRQGVIRSGPKPRVAVVNRYVRKILKGQHMKETIKFSASQEGGDVLFEYKVDEEAISRIASIYFGKSILFTDREDLDAGGIIRTYRAQYQVEDAFKQLKDSHHVSFTPVYHWTDDKIRVHAFYCVLALTLSSLLVRRLHKAGVAISPQEMYTQLSDIREVLLLYPQSGGKSKAVTMISKMNPVQSELFKVLDLSRFAHS